MLAVRGLGKYYGGVPVFREVTLTAGTGDKIGIIGRNGAGKTTLLRCLAGLTDPDEGEVTVPKSVRVGYLAQREEETPSPSGAGTAPEGLTVEEAALEVFASLIAAEAELREMEARLAAGEQGELLARYGAALELFEHAGGYDYRHRTRTVLAGLGFGPDMLERRVAHLSGGERVRLGLARLLLSEPDVLLLDEPTNHLDMDAVEWLEGFLQRLPATVIVVSHDRTFLDRVTGRTWEVEGGAVIDYRGGYTRAMEQKALALQSRRREYEAYLKEREKLERFVARFRAGTRARQAQDRLRKLERLEAAAPSQIPHGEPGTMRLAFGGGGARGGSGRTVCRADGVTVAFGRGEPVLRDVTFELPAGARVGLVGANGAGKTTLLRVMAGELVPRDGWVEWEGRLHIGYFSQHYRALAPDATVLETVLERHAMSPREARSALAAFLFRGEQVDQPVGTLSGGEQARLALLLLMLSEPDVLLLDEPTNHLDLPSRTALEEALAGFGGTLVTVSHDRYFLDRVTDTTWWLQDGSLTVWEGPYSAFREQLRSAEAPPEEAPSAPSRPRRKEAPRTTPRKTPTDVAELEERIARLEEEQEALGRRLADPALYRDSEEDAASLVARYRAVEGELEELYAAWEAEVTEQ